MQFISRSLIVMVFAILAACVVVVGFVCVCLGQQIIGLICILGASSVFMVALFVNSQSAWNRYRELLKAIGEVHSNMWGECTVDDEGPFEYELRFGEIAMWVSIPKKIVTVVPYVNILASNASVHDNDLKMNIVGVGKKCVFEHDDKLRLEAVKQWIREKCIMSQNEETKEEVTKRKRGRKIVSKR